MIQTMIDRLWRKPPHYIRLVSRQSGKVPPKTRPTPRTDCGVASARWLEYDEERIFELLPEILTTIHQKDRYGSVVVEADADGPLRFAYPYDHRVFVMPIPQGAEDVFRDPVRAAAELRKALDDTAAFASEIFGLFSDAGADEPDPAEERVDLTATQMRGFLYSPLGDELATRIQLQPPYHGLVESDVIVVNEAFGRPGPNSEECLRRIRHLLERTHRQSERGVDMFLVDLGDAASTEHKRLLKRLKPICRGGS